MIRNGNWKSNVNSTDAVVNLTKMRLNLSDEKGRCNVLRKCKSVGNSEMRLQHEGHPMLPLISTSRRRNDCRISRSASRSENSRNETRSVKSDTACTSPAKPMRIDLFKRSDHWVAKRSPSSVLDFEKPSSQHQSLSEKLTLSGHDRSVLQQFIGFDNSNLTMSSCFSDEETIDDGLSFAGDDLASFPTSAPISVSNITIPSEHTGSNETLTLSGSSPSKPTPRRKRETLPAIASRTRSDFIPLPPTRKTSNRDSPLKERSKPLVPQHIQCFPMDESPMKPARRTSIGNGSSSSSLLTRLSIDLSPEKPKRQNSGQMSNSKSSFMVSSCISVDSSPQKPERQKSNSSLLNSSHSIGIHSDSRILSGGPPRRKVLRSESKLQPPRLPTLTRRISIMEREIKQSQVVIED